MSLSNGAKYYSLSHGQDSLAGAPKRSSDSRVGRPGALERLATELCSGETARSLV